MSNITKEYILTELNSLLKAKNVLDYSFQKCKKITLNSDYSDEEHEHLEAFTSRFARLSDLIIQKTFRLIDYLDLEESLTVRDRIMAAEKKELIESAQKLIEIRALRNKIAHDYVLKSIDSIFEETLLSTEFLMNAVDRIENYIFKKYL
ncbi:MAG: hypothetical protein EAZ27_11830 [Cytophagales bacterium]|nr:MAG: hypothetical protein EAZ27_11830 [Cytophagales bacterium]